MHLCTNPEQMILPLKILFVCLFCCLKTCTARWFIYTFGWYASASNPFTFKGIHPPSDPVHRLRHMNCQGPAIHLSRSVHICIVESRPHYTVIATLYPNQWDDCCGCGVTALRVIAAAIAISDSLNLFFPCKKRCPGTCPPYPTRCDLMPSDLLVSAR